MPEYQVKCETHRIFKNRESLGVFKSPHMNMHY